MRLGHFVVAMVLVSSPAARADSFNFTFGTSSSSFSGSGVLTTSILEAPGEYSIASVTGTAVIAPLGPSLGIGSILAPGTFPTISNGDAFPANDNVLFLTNGIGSLDGNGLSFILSNGVQINLYNPDGSSHDALLEDANGNDTIANLPITITAVTSTPEPSSLVLLGTGLLGIASSIKRRLK